MKGMGINLVSVLVSVIMLGSTMVIKEESTTCSDLLIWYTISSGQGSVPASINCPINVNTLVLGTYGNLGAEFPAVVNSTDFPMDRLATRSQYIVFSGCNTDEDFVCAVGFEVDLTPDGEFEVISGCIFPKRNPVTLESISLVKCIIFRSTL